VSARVTPPLAPTLQCNRFLAVTLFILFVLPEEHDGSVQAVHNTLAAKLAAQLLQTRASSNYYLRSCPAVVPAQVSNLLRILSNGSAQIDSIIPAIITVFFPLSGYFLQVGCIRLQSPPPTSSCPPLTHSRISRVQGRVGKAVIVLTVIVAIWFDFYERQLKNLDLQAFNDRLDITSGTLLVDVPGTAPPPLPRCARSPACVTIVRRQGL
jgi:hypothetical protein